MSDIRFVSGSQITGELATRSVSINAQSLRLASRAHREQTPRWSFSRPTALADGSLRLIIPMRRHRPSTIRFRQAMLRSPCSTAGGNGPDLALSLSTITKRLRGSSDSHLHGISHHMLAFTCFTCLSWGGMS